jgi:dipeptidyl aminopeptidase/acylaminoacyl peptidase
VIHLPRRLEIEDLEKFVMASHPQLSPDSESLAYVVTRAQGDTYFPTLYLVDPKDGTPRKFWEKARSPVWSPDGSQLAFVSNRGLKEGEKGAEIWVTTPCGEPRLVCKASGGVEQPAWSGDGERIYYLGFVGEEPKDAHVMEHLPFWFDGVGWIYYRRKHLHVVDVASGAVKQLTEGEVDVICHAPSNRGEQVAYALAETESAPRETTLYVLDQKKGECRKILEKHTLASLGWSPDDELVFFSGNDLSYGYPTHTTVWVIPPIGGEPTDLTVKLDYGSSRVVYNDLRSQYAGAPNPVWDGDRIYFPVSEGGRYELHSVRPEDGEISPVVGGDFCVEEFSVRGGVIAYTRTGIAEPMEVYVKKGKKEVKITRLTEAPLTEAPMIDGEHFTFEASDGETIEGWLLKPYGWKRGKRYSAIFDIHGGPRSKYGYAPMFEHQIYAAEGYAVVYANIRGSDGYDQEFADIRFRYGTRDYHDFMETVDHALGAYDWIDETRIAVTGLSYGGFMTNWVIGHTGRFRCALSQNSICNWVSFFGTTDIGFHFGPDQIGGDPWSNPAAYAEKSPLTYAKNVKTPTMFIHSMNDNRCWIDQSIQMYTALKFQGVETKLILYTEGSHSFRNLARPAIRKRRLHDMVDWFNQHLK